MTRLAIFTCTAAYTGYIPIAPGTFGSLAGLALYVAVRQSESIALETAVLLIVLALGVWSASIGERYFGTIDPGPIVIDEVAGMLITLAFIPVGWSGAIGGFFLFRLFDVIKPYPAARLERLQGGLGVMADDAMAAVYANLGLRLIGKISPEWIA